MPESARHSSRPGRPSSKRKTDIKKIVETLENGGKIKPVATNAYDIATKQQAVAMRLRGWKWRDIAQHLGIKSHRTIAGWMEDDKLLKSVMSAKHLQELTNGLTAKQLRNAAIFSDLAAEPERYASLNSYQLQTMSGIAVDKVLALQGKSPAQFEVNIAIESLQSTSKDISEEEAELKKIEDEILEAEVLEKQESIQDEPT